MALNAGAFVLGAELLPARPAAAAVLLAVAPASFVVLVRRELPRENPLIPVDLLRSRPFRVSVIASVCCFVGQTAGMVALPFYLQHGLHQTAFMTGLLVTPWPLTVALTAPLAGLLADRIPSAWLCAAGGAVLALGLAAIAAWPVDGGPLPLVPLVVLCGAGFGLFQVPNNREMFLGTPLERSGAAGGMQSTARLTGQTAGAVVMTLLFASVSADAAPSIGLAVGASMTLVAGLVSTLRRPQSGVKS